MVPAKIAFMSPRLHAEVEEGPDQMPSSPLPADLIAQLRIALKTADALGMSRIACHIDHALALAVEVVAIGQPAPEPRTRSVM